MTPWAAWSWHTLNSANRVLWESFASLPRHDFEMPFLAVVPLALKSELEPVASGLDGMRRTIRETEPPRPSTRLSTTAAESLTMTAQQRHIEALRTCFR